MSQGYSTNASAAAVAVAFERAWNPYSNCDDDWCQYASNDITENLQEFDEHVLDHIETLIHETSMMSPDSQMPMSTSDQSPSNDQMLASPTHSCSSSTVPVCTPYPGDYGFEVTLEKQQKKTKSANWIYFSNLDKLFVKINKPCPFLFKTAKKPPPGSIIRALPVYLNPEHIQEVVRRCPTHRVQSSNESSSLAQHLIVSDHQLAKHVEDSYTHRLSIVIPYEDPQAGAEWVTNLYKFMCFSSCHNGYSRRPLHVIFTLEGDNKVLGRQVVKVRCCASPGRDGCQEEENQSGKKTAKRRLGTAAGGDDLAAFMPDTKRQRSGKGNEIYTIQVRGRENYETLRHLRDSLELADHLPQEIIAQFRKQQMEMDNWYLNDEQRAEEERRLSLAAAAASVPAAPTMTQMQQPPPSASGKTKKRSISMEPMVNSYDYTTNIPVQFQTNQIQNLFYQ